MFSLCLINNRPWTFLWLSQIKGLRHEMSAYSVFFSKDQPSPLINTLKRFWVGLEFASQLCISLLNVPPLPHRDLTFIQSALPLPAQGGSILKSVFSWRINTKCPPPCGGKHQACINFSIYAVIVQNWLIACMHICRVHACMQANFTQARHAR